MKAERFIAGKLKFRGRIAMFCIAVSFFVMIVAVAVSTGFRDAVRDGISSVSGDVMIAPADLGYMTGSSPIERNPAYLPKVEAEKCVESVIPVTYRAGIVKNGDRIQGVLFKGIPGDLPGQQPSDSLPSLAVSVPSGLSDILGTGEGDELLSYFVGEKVRVRKFRVVSVYESMLDSDDMLVVYARMSDIQRLNGWSQEQVSAFEILLADGCRTEDGIREATSDIGALTAAYAGEDEASVVCTSSVSDYPQLFDWLNLLDFNVFFILVLMTLVAGFNMISGLLILLFENISLIGTLKALGMTDRSIAEVFLRVSSSHVLKGMFIGNALAFLFCIIQSSTGILTLDPANYFVSEVPVSIDYLKVLAADIASYAAIMLLLLLPSMFIAKIDPAKTVRMN